MTRMNRFASGAAVVLALVITAGAWAEEPKHAYIGADKCKMCHNSEAKGAQYTKWAASAHARAYQTLGTEAAKKFAATKNIADPQKAGECLQCHVTGHGVAAAKLTDKYKAEEGVSCESCHGPGGDYWKMNVMKDLEQSKAAGLNIPTAETCTACHNEKSPTFKGFDFAAMAAKIAHPNPQKAAAK